MWSILLSRAAAVVVAKTPAAAAVRVDLEQQRGLL
jgi:hypothetical protein